MKQKLNSIIYATGVAVINLMTLYDLFRHIHALSDNRFDPFFQRINSSNKFSHEVDTKSTSVKIDQSIKMR